MIDKIAKSLELAREAEDLLAADRVDEAIDKLTFV
jgi:hypothetical protein